LFPKFGLKISPGAICDWGGSQGSGQAVTGPISHRGSHLEVCKGHRNFLTFIGIYHIVEGVIVLKCIPERFGLCWVSIKGVGCHPDGSWWCCSHVCCGWVWCWWWVSSGWWRWCLLDWGWYLNRCRWVLCWWWISSGWRRWLLLGLDCDLCQRRWCGTNLSWWCG